MIFSTLGEHFSLDDYLTLIYGWSGIWLTICVILLISRHGKNIADYEIVGFRASIAFVCLSVALRRVFDLRTEFIVPALSVFAWTAMMNTVRVALTIWKERRERHINYIVQDYPISGVVRVEKGVSGPSVTIDASGTDELHDGIPGMGRVIGPSHRGVLTERPGGHPAKESAGSEVG